MYYKKSQISIFIIISTILVLFLIAFITFSSDFEFFADETVSFRVTEHVEACINQQLQEGMNTMGRQGGWLYTPDEISFAKRGDIDTIVENSQGIYELSTNKIPYWHYYDDTDQIYKMNYIPPFDSNDEDSIKMQLKRYLDDTLESHCLQGFSAFDDAYDILYQKESINHSIEFIQDDIMVSLEMPIEIREVNSNSTQFVQDFSNSAPNKLKTPYHLAKDIANAQNQTSFIDKRAMQLLVPYMSKDTRELLPPMYDFSLTYDPQPWVVPEVEKVTKQVLSSNFRKVQLLETNSQVQELPSEIENSQLAQGINGMFSKYYLGNPEEGEDLSVTREEKPQIFEDYQNYNAIPNFESFYPLSFQLTPSAGNVLVMPDAEYFTGFVPLPTTSYQTAYEFHGPLVFSIQNSQTPNDDFEFRVAYEMNVEHNKPLSDNYPEPDVDFQQQSQQDVSKSLVCDRAQFVSEDIELNITDPIKGRNSVEDAKQGVDNAFIEFSCKNGIAVCPVGTTSLDEDKRTDLTLNLPVNCDPGTLMISKQGHKSVEIDEVNPKINEELNLGEVNMASSKTLQLDVSLRPFEEVANSRLQGSVGEHDSGVLVLEHKTEDNFVAVAEFDEDSIDSKNVSLLPGEYSVEAFVIHEDKDLIVPEEEICEGGSLFTSETCVTLPEVELPAWLRASYQLDSFEVSTEDLINSNTLKIELLDIGVPFSYNSLEALSNKIDQVKSKSSQYPPELRYEN